MAWVERTDELAYVLAPLFTFVVAVLPIPAEIPAALNGIIFGPVWGSLVTWLSALAGAQVSFELARRWGQPLTRRFVRDHLIARAGALVVDAGWPTLLALRLLPTVAFTAVNWAAGLSPLPRRTFVWTTTLGILPGAIVFTATGSGLLALARTHGLGVVLWGLVALLLLVAFVLGARRRARTAAGSRP